MKILLIALSLIVASPSAWACRCLRIVDFLETSQTMFSQKDEDYKNPFLLTVTPTSYILADGTETTEEAKDPQFSNPLAKKVNFEVTGFLKGDLRKDEKVAKNITLPISLGNSCSHSPYHFKIGKSYLIVLSSTIGEDADRSFSYRNFSCEQHAMNIQEVKAD